MKLSRFNRPFQLRRLKRTAAKAARQADAEQASYVASTAAYATYSATAIGYAIQVKDEAGEVVGCL